MRATLAIGTILGLISQAVPAQVTPKAEAVTLQLADAPHLFHRRDGSVVAKWVVDGKVEQARFIAGESIDIPAFRRLLGRGLELRRHAPEPDTWTQPDKLLVISDVEGQYGLMSQFLRANGVIDAKDRWTFGKGHLVCVGDMVDRGTEVTETLLLMYRLAGEARAAGGHLHYVLGNHEVMVMGGDVRYVAPKYRAIAALLKIPVTGLFGADTEIGRWLRTRNSIVKIGRFVFVHAGISPPLLAGNLEIGQLNRAMRTALGVPPTKIRNQTIAAILWGRLGPLWYRGYFKEWAADFGPTPKSADIDAILQKLEAKTIVIGHTKVKAVTDLYGGRRVLAIDVPWTMPDKVRGLLIQGDRIDVVDRRGKRTELK